MNTIAPIPAVKVLSSLSTIPAWSEVRPQDLSKWNDALFGTNCALYQYPFWNEPYRPMWATPRYLAWGSQAKAHAFATILTLGCGPAKIGLVFRGPVSLNADTPVPQEAITDLLAWARAQGYIFVRFTNSDPEVMTRLAAAGHAEDFDAFPYLLDYSVLSGDYVVKQFDCEDETLASFDREARRKLRRAAEAGYEFHSEDSPEALEKIWHLYQECSQRKQFRLERPLSVYMEAMRLARSHDRVRLYTARWNGKVVGSTLVFRDRTTAHCQLAAFDVDHRHSAVFLHWNSMRDMHRMGAHRYNLGPGPKTLARFKSQFCQTPVTYPGPLTIVLKKGWFRLWRKAFVPMAKQLQPALRQIAFQRERLTRAVTA